MPFPGASPNAHFSLCPDHKKYRIMKLFFKWRVSFLRFRGPSTRALGNGKMQFKISFFGAQERVEKFSRKLIFPFLCCCRIINGIFWNNPTDLFGPGRISYDVFTFPHPVSERNRFTESRRGRDGRRRNDFSFKTFGYLLGNIFELNSILTFSTQYLYLNAFMRLLLTTRKTKK